MAAKQAIYPRRKVLVGLAALGIGGTGMIALGVRSLIDVLGYPHTLLVYNGHADFINSAAWSPDGTRIASASEDGTVQVWDASTGQTLQVYRGHNFRVNQAAWSPDSSLLASSGGGSIHLWEPDTGRLLAKFDKGGAFAWSPDGSRLASSGGIEDPAQIWEVASGQTLVTTQQTHLSERIFWSPDGTCLVSTNYSGEVIIWDTATGKTLLTYRGHAHGFGSIALAIGWSPDGTKLVSGGDLGGRQW